MDLHLVVGNAYSTVASIFRVFHAIARFLLWLGPLPLEIVHHKRKKALCIIFRQGSLVKKSP